MKQKLLLVFMGLVFAVGNVMANAYNAKLNVKIKSNPSGCGLVYASMEDKVPADSEWKSEDTSVQNPESGSGVTTFTFYAFAKPKDASCRFEGWYADEECTRFLSSDTKYSIGITAVENNVWAEETIFASFSKIMNCEVELLDAENGTYSATAFDVEGVVEEGSSLSTQTRISLECVPDEGYKVMGWYTLDKDGNKVYFSYQERAEVFFQTSSERIGVDLVGEDVPVFCIKNKCKAFVDLNEANSAADEGDIIVLASSGTLGKGDYVIKSGVTLLIPFDKDWTCITTEHDPDRVFVEPTPYLTLVMEDGATINVEGTISVSARMHAINGNTANPDAGVTGPYGLISMKEKSQIIVKDGGTLYAWGYIIGNGKVDAQAGSSVFETYQIAGFRGGNAISSMANSNNPHVFPFSQYYVQNIEAPLTIHYGATEYVMLVFSADNVYRKSEVITYIGDDGMFELSTGSSLTKSYNPSKDRLGYFIEGDADLNDISMEFEMSPSSITVSSSDYVLPLTNNMSININKGTLSFKNKGGVAILPGVELNVNEGATLDIGDNNVYVYDVDNWGNYVFANRQFKPIYYVPTRTYTRTTLSDATLNIEGSLVASGKGRIYTTVGGANVCCKSGRGSITLTSDTESEVEEVTYQALQNNTTITYDAIPITPAKLYNYITKDYTPTSSADPDTTYYYVHGQWTTGKTPLDGVLFGDVFKDGKLDDKDFKILLKLVFDKKVTRYDYKNSDVNNDGKYHSIADLAKFIELWNKVKAEEKE